MLAPPSASPESRVTSFRHSLLVETPNSRRACLFVGVGGLLALFVAILCMPHHLVYDEVFHLTTVKALFRLGFSREFLMGTPWSAPGPLYALVQGAFAPFTGARPPGIRLVNFGCVLGMAALLASALRVRGTPGAASVALGILAAPVSWSVFAAAMTEAPAMLCAAGGIWLTVLWQRANWTPGRRDAAAVCAGLLLGAAVIGRQVYVAAIPAIVLLARRDTLRPTVLQLLAACLLPAGLFGVWGGFAPPMFSVGHGLRPSSAIDSFAVTGVTALLLAPRFFSLSLRQYLGLAGSLLILNLVFGFHTHLPLGEFLVKHHVPPAGLRLVERAWGSGLLIMAALFAASGLWNLWQERSDREFLFLCAATLLLALTPIKITHVWDVRYITVTLPFLVVALGPWTTNNYARAMRLTLGMLVAAAHMNNAIKTTWDEQNPPTMVQLFPELQPNK